MTEVKRDSLRRRLTVALLAISIVPLTVAGMLLGWYSYNTQLDRVFAQQQREASNVANKVIVFLQDASREVEELSRFQTFYTLPPQKQREYMYELLVREKIYRELYVVDADGSEFNMVTMRDENYNSEHHNWSGRPEFQAAIENKPVSEESLSNRSLVSRCSIWLSRKLICAAVRCIAPSLQSCA